ncbi:hypothetical protein EJ05DRAFT_479119 [Pseudovirgaria hyperparasitica]|uniref:tRNA-splicing endonuclease subunit Sen2 n=1 Tax=Pseudovirgaria hyperparasitica TaxID=470096 RepID=A0A6A6VVG5_9PEZI|nr:uncharacterized protein EJ05DRAFT_479119 [Pseudovirgaria hyperparasitica]KAF2754678.1 hypothetical protein EJ05DRAFT_479119 [Pseudovirgaria hyperparasitica]
MAMDNDTVHLKPNHLASVHQSRNTKHSKRRLHEIYELPLPVVCHPLPALIPHNPLSILRIAYVVVSGLIWPQSSHPSALFRGSLSTITQSVHITDAKAIRALWEKGFFGKGSLSRSDPSWLAREKRRLGLMAAQTSEDNTRARRVERRQMKYERALKEREAIEEQLREEAKKDGSLSSVVDTTGNFACVETATHENVPSEEDISTSSPGKQPGQHVPKIAMNGHDISELPFEPPVRGTVMVPEDIDDEELGLANEEHLQLSLEETFFLVFGLGILEVFPEDKSDPLTAPELFDLCRSLSYYPAASATLLAPDDPFLVKYIVYHHFRSLGWVVRHGNKFSVDFLLYNRGPVFSHAEFAIMILPSYSHPHWRSTVELTAKVDEKERRDWWWFHCINRVQAHVRKTLVLVYVDIPPPSAINIAPGETRNIGSVLKQYRVREFVLRRWLMNRSRD